MAEVGHVAIVAALLLAVYVCVAGPLALRLHSSAIAASARRGVFGVCAMLSAASATLFAAFLTHDFSIRYVAEHSSRDMPGALVAAAFYSGQQGSLLYWCWTLSIFAVIVVWRSGRDLANMMPYVQAVLMYVVAFFAFLLSFISSPFERLPVIPRDGLGLNPLLYDSGMLYHPPMLLAGYMSWTVPFAFAIGALLSGRLDTTWISATRRYSLVAWAILGLGNLLGAWWAYRVLGWGGYWGWDPVENSAIMPWLLGTAFIHSVMIQERRGMLKIWNISLILTTFYLSIFGTFIVRSGIITSVHSFAQSSIGPYFLAYISSIVFGSLALLAVRLPSLKSDNQLESLASREAAFLLNNLLFGALVFAIFWGSIFPLVSEAVQGLKVTVGPPFFNQVGGPIMIALIFLMAIGPVLPWRRTSASNLATNLAAPLAFAAACALLVWLALGGQHPVALVTLFACALVVGTVLVEVVRGTLARQRATGETPPLALWGLLRRNNRRYGGYAVHIGIVLLAAGVTGSTFYQVEQQVRLAPGDSVTIAGYRLTFTGLAEHQQYDYRAMRAVLAVTSNGTDLGTLAPEKRFHRNFERQPSSEVAIRSSPVEDLYIVLGGWDEAGSASFLLFVNPMVMWLWIGGALSVVGGLFAFWPSPSIRLAEVVQPARPLAVSSA
ncbi:MAG: heme lyase CcmF/NrfE family subunit [Chloroflexota bacterium]